MPGAYTTSRMSSSPHRIPTRVLLYSYPFTDEKLRLAEGDGLPGCQRVHRELALKRVHVSTQVGRTQPPPSPSEGPCGVTSPGLCSHLHKMGMQRSLPRTPKRCLRHNHWPIQRSAVCMLSPVSLPDTLRGAQGRGLSSLILQMRKLRPRQGQRQPSWGASR